MTLLPGEMCAKESCGFPYVHPPHPYSTWSMYRLIELLKNTLHCADDEQLLEVLATGEIANLKLASAAPESDQSRSEPVGHTEDQEDDDDDVDDEFDDEEQDFEGDACPLCGYELYWRGSVEMYTCHGVEPHNFTQVELEKIVEAIKFKDKERDNRELFRSIKIPRIEVPEFRFTSGDRIEPGMQLTIDRHTGHIVPLRRETDTK